MKKFLIEESEKKNILSMHKSLMKEQTKSTGLLFPEEGLLRKAISAGCLKNGSLKRQKSTGKIYYKKESIKQVGKFVRFFPDMTFAFEDGSKKGKWVCPQLATVTATEVTTQQTNADNTSKVNSLKQQGWKSKNELIDVDLNTIDKVYDKQIIGDVVLYKIKGDVNDVTKNTGTADFNVKQNSFIDEFTGKGYELNPERVKRTKMVAVTAKELGAPDDLFPNGLTLYYDPNKQDDIKSNQSLVSDLLKNQAVNREACRKNVEDYYRLFKTDATIDPATLYKIKTVVQACKNQHKGKWGILGGGKKLDNYLDILSGVKEGGPSSYGDNSKWRLK